VASKLVSALVAGIAGGLLIGCAFPVMLKVADILSRLLSRPEEVSPIVTPAGDQNLGIAVMLFLLCVFVLVPTFLAVTGAVSVRLARIHLPDKKAAS
jgi:hypothetical protein